MLEQLRQNSRSFIIWILFGIIIAAFIITFGPQAGLDTVGCGTASSSFAVRVDGQDVKVSSWRFAMNGLGFGSGGGSSTQAIQQRFVALDYLVERELLAQAAEERGFRVSDEQLNRAVQTGEFLMLGHRFNGENIYFIDGIFDYEALERFARSLGLPSVAALLDEQRREHLAELMRSAIMAGVRVSDEEARTEYIQSNTKITADYVKFEVARYAAAMKLSEDQLKTYASSHEEELKKAWETQKTQWESDQARVLARHIFFKKDAASGEGAEASAGGADKARAALERLNKGEDFASVAAEVSEDARTSYRGGSLGWRPATSLGWGQSIVDAVAKLEPGKVSDVLEGDRGWHIFRVDERSDKGLSFEQKRLDLAASAAPKFYADKRAEHDAQAAIALAATTPLDQQFERGAAPSQLPGGQQISPEQLEQLMKQIEEQQRKKNEEQGFYWRGRPQPGDTLMGWEIREGPIVLAQAGGDADEPAADKPAADKPAADKPAAAAGDAAPAAGAPAPPADENLPKPVDLAPASLRTLGPVSRGGDFLAGIGRSKQLVSALFDDLQPGSIATRPFKVTDPDGWVVVQLKDRALADLEKFKEEAPAMRADLRSSKAAIVLSKWIQDRCQAAAQAGNVAIDPAMAQVEDDAKTPPPQYAACGNINLGSVLEQQRTRLLTSVSY